MHSSIGKQIIAKDPELATILGVDSLGTWLYTRLPSPGLWLETMLAVVAPLLLVWLSLRRRIQRYQQVLRLADDALTHCGKSEKGELPLLPVSTDEPLARFGRHFNESLHRIHASSELYTGVSSKLADVAHTLSATASDILLQVDQQQKKAQEVKQQLERMQTVFATATETASQTMDLSARSEAEGNSGKLITTEAMSGVAALADSVNDTGEIIATLGKDSEAIGGFINVIRGVAEQTNLLALNAAIEAARAGEQGRGFAMVPNEVRSLANKTRKSTDEIQRIIEQLAGHVRRAKSRHIER